MKSVWAIAGTLADKKTVHGLGLEFGGAEDMPAAIKIGKLATAEDILSIGNFLKNYRGPVVLDLSSDFEELLPYVTVLVVDLREAEIFLNRTLDSQQSIQDAAAKLLHSGAQGVLIKGKEGLWLHDYWTDGTQSFWLTQRRDVDVNYLETGDVFSVAIAGALALGHSSEDALVIATMYVQQAIRRAHTDLYYGGFSEDESDVPYLSSAPLYKVPEPFKRSHYLGLYPVVDSADWVEFLLKLGVKTIQLRIKERTKELVDEMRRSIALAKKYQATLFINDYWDLALELGAEAVHLGQSDLDTADLDAIRHKGLLLGVSTYCYYEVARAHAICPSYIAIGPIYPTTSKDMVFLAQGIEKLQVWQRILHYPLVAIGGINLERAADVVATGVCGIALISAITEAADPKKATQHLLNLTEKGLFHQN